MSSSWLEISSNSDFSLSNLPFGVISHASEPEARHIAVAIGSHVLDLHVFTDKLGFQSDAQLQQHQEVFRAPSLNAFAALGRAFHRRTRSFLQDLFLTDTKTSTGTGLRDDVSFRSAVLFKQADVTNRLPMSIGDYTDFYAGLHHAYNVGVLFRGPDNALQPNYRHLPVAYHGRASSVVVSGTSIRRPWGQVLDQSTKDTKQPNPRFQPCARLDYELELGAFICRGNEMGTPVPVREAGEYIFGVVLMNDWSARDIQAWEYVPLGPFNSKNVGTSISPWVVLADALEPFRTKGLENTVELVKYLDEGRRDTVYDINLRVDLSTASQTPRKPAYPISSTKALNLLYSFPQMIAHHTITGCPLRPGDLLGSGTISGTEPGSEGALLETTRGGKQKVQLGGNDEERTFLEDGDTVIMRGWCEKPGVGRVGFGECVGTILPAWEDPLGAH